MSYAGKHYFAMDGSYGSATEILIVDTSLWDNTDWAAIEEASDDERSNVAQSIIDHYESKARN
jgi:hypothetical protein